MGRNTPVAEMTGTAILLLIAIIIAGCTNPVSNSKGNAIAIDIALDYPDIASEIQNSNNDYAAVASPADPAVRGYYNYAGDLYDVTIDTANLGPGSSPKNYLGHFQALVDVDRRQVMAIQYSYDVATMPWHITLPANAIWYQRISPPLHRAYIEMKLDALNQSVKPMVIDYENLRIMLDGRPHMAFSLSDLGENATAIDLNESHSPITTFLQNVTVTPGRMPFPGNLINGSGVSFTFRDPGRDHYFVLVNKGPADETIDAIVK